MSYLSVVTKQGFNSKERALEVHVKALPPLASMLAHPAVQLRPSEHSREETEKQCLIALRLLRYLADNYGSGFDRKDSLSSFIKSLLAQPKPWSIAQLRTAYNIVKKYEERLADAGFNIPIQGKVDALCSQQEERVARVSTARVQIDISEDQRWLTFHMPHYRKEWHTAISNFKTEFTNQAIKSPQTWFDGQKARYEYDRSTAIWTFPCSLAIYKSLTSAIFFPLATVELLPGAQAFQANIEQEEFKNAMRLEEVSKEELRRYEELRASIGGLEATFGRGIKLYKHQREAVEILLKRNRFLLADETGLGKTMPTAVAALARQRTDGVRIYVVTTVSSMDMWEETFAELGASCEVFSWSPKSIPTSDAEYPPQRFVLIADEGHKACNEAAQCTQKFLALAQHPNCDACYVLTGTPVPNGRPVNLYSLLLAMRHPLVYDESSIKQGRKKISYLDRYCGRHRKHIGSGTYVWDVNGATYLWDLNRRTIYVPGAAENHADACIIARLKADCVDLPEKQRVLQPVEISAEARRVFQDAVIELWDRFEESVKGKLELFKQEFHKENGRMPDKGEVAAKEQKIRRAEAVVSYGIFRQAGAKAKIEYAVEQAQVILDSGKHKLVIFTSFKKVARLLGEKLAEIYGTDRIGYIMDEVSREDRGTAVNDFQNKDGKIWIIISTAAGGEAITLTEAQHMLILDRPWTPGRVKQWEDRIHRLTTRGTVTIYWLQLPKDLSDADIRVDKIIQFKQVNIDAMQYGKVTAGMTFTSYDELEDSAENIISATRKRIRRKKAASSAA